ncbi:Crp/Fnr family transcriptional regulator, partial [Halobacteriales archaeon SW_12_67_38]
EAATKGLDVCLLAVADRLSAHTGELRDGNVSYEVVDTTT